MPEGKPGDTHREELDRWGKQLEQSRRIRTEQEQREKRQHDAKMENMRKGLDKNIDPRYR